MLFKKLRPSELHPTSATRGWASNYDRGISPGDDREAGVMDTSPTQTSQKLLPQTLDQLARNQNSPTGVSLPVRWKANFVDIDRGKIIESVL